MIQTTTSFNSAERAKKSALNILFILTHGISPQKGGIERMSLNFGTDLEKRGHKVWFIAFFDEYKNDLSWPERQFFFPNNDRKSPESREFLRNLLCEKQIDLVIFQIADVAIPHSSLYAELNVPVIVCLHFNPDFVETMKRSKARAKLGNFADSWLYAPILALKIFFPNRNVVRHYRQNAEIAERFVLLSEGFIPWVSKRFPRELRRKIVAIPNFTTVPRQDCAAEKEKILLFVGRLENGQKRVDLLLKIWAKLEKAFPQWRLEIVGDGPSRGGLEALAGTLGLQRVTFEGFQKPEKYYRRAPIFCMTSAFEGFPMVLAEAAAFGCVPVAFESFAAVRDIISDGENGALVPPFDLDKYAETLAALMRDDALRERLAANTAQICEKFAPAKIVNRWEALFAEVLAEKNK